MSGEIAIDWTVGEFAVESGTAFNRFFTEGFHQPLLFIYKVEPKGEPITEIGQSLDLTVNPNPVFASLSIDFPEPLDHAAKVIILDSNGRLVVSETLQNGLSSHKIDLSNRAAGRYILKIIDEKGQSSSAYQIIKVD